MRTSCVLAAVIVLPANPAFSTTWDEPWQDQVLKSAESFARYEVLENEGGHLVLKKLQETASTEEVGFESNLMDPRIGTRFPDSVKAAIQELLEEWTGKKKEPPAEGKGSTE